MGFRGTPTFTGVCRILDPCLACSIWLSRHHGAKAFRTGGSGEIVIDGETGLLVSTNDIDAITAAMRRLVLDPDLRMRLGVAARERTKTVFTMSQFVGGYAALYEELAEAKHVLARRSLRGH